MTGTDRILGNASEYAAAFDKGSVAARPATGVVIVSCMDARIDLYALFGLSVGDAHILRNAGGIVTDDTIRSLAISQRLLGTTDVVFVHHTECGMLSITDETFAWDLERETGLRPRWAAGAFRDLYDDVRVSIERVKSSPFVPHKDGVRGFVYDVGTGKLDEVAPAA